MNKSIGVPLSCSTPNNKKNPPKNSNSELVEPTPLTNIRKTERFSELAKPGPSSSQIRDKLNSSISFMQKFRNIGLNSRTKVDRGNRLSNSLVFKKLDTTSSSEDEEPIVRRAHSTPVKSIFINQEHRKSSNTGSQVKELGFDRTVPNYKQKESVLSKNESLSAKKESKTSLHSSFKKPFLPPKRKRTSSLESEEPTSKKQMNNSNAKLETDKKSEENQTKMAELNNETNVNTESGYIDSEVNMYQLVDFTMVKNIIIYFIGSSLSPGVIYMCHY